MLRNAFDYELALSYAAKDNVIVDKFYKRFRDIFSNSVFKYDQIPERLAASNNLNDDLKQLFSRLARCVVIFHSKNYEDGIFTKTEFKSILQRLSDQPEFVFFIVKLDDDDGLMNTISDKFYIRCNDDAAEIDRTVDTIKKRLIISNLENAADNCIDIVVRSKAGNKSLVEWERNANWCIMLDKFFEGDYLIKLKQGCKWEDAVKYFNDEFNYAYGLFRRDRNKKIKFSLNCHYTFAFLAGRAYGRIGYYGNPNLAFRQYNGSGFDLSWEGDKADYKDFYYETEGRSEEGRDALLTISIKRNIKTDVDKFACNNAIDASLRIYAKLEDNVVNGPHLALLMQSLLNKLKEKYIHKDGRLHVFFNGPVPFMFMLGSNSQFLGTSCIYEYLGGAYERSI